LGPADAGSSTLLPRWRLLKTPACSRYYRGTRGAALTFLQKRRKLYVARPLEAGRKSPEIRIRGSTNSGARMT